MLGRDMWQFFGSKLRVSSSNSNFYDEVGPIYTADDFSGGLVTDWLTIVLKLPWKDE